jgi:hypothetical protein
MFKPKSKFWLVFCDERAMSERRACNEPAAKKNPRQGLAGWAERTVNKLRIGFQGEKA